MKTNEIKERTYFDIATIETLEVVFGIAVEAFAKNDTDACITWGNAKRRAERVQAWTYERRNRQYVDVYIGHATPWAKQYAKQIQNGYETCLHSAHDNGTEVVLAFDSQNAVQQVLRAWAKNYGVVDNVKNACKDKANSVMTA